MYQNVTTTLRSTHATLDINGYKLLEDRMDSVPIDYRSQCHPLTYTVTVVHISVVLSVLVITVKRDASQTVKVCLHLTSFSPFNVAPFNGPFFY